jgi:hypothetical protein
MSESKNRQWILAARPTGNLNKKGDLVQGMFGWQDYTYSSAS